MVEGKSLLTRDSIEKLRSLVTDLQLVDRARGIISLFSARHPSETGGIPAPLFPRNCHKAAKYEELVHRVMNNELIRGKLLSSDRSLAAIVLSLDPAAIERSKLKKRSSTISAPR